MNFIGECKWSRINNPDSMLKDLEQKASQFLLAKGKNIFTALFIKETSENKLPSNVFLSEGVLGRLKS
jgi:hypothetical protein